MGVYNPLAEMPKNCAVCHEECKHRNITAHKRHKRCPLVEVKMPHGRLIDADELRNFIYDNYAMSAYSHYMDIFLPELRNAPTVIEAEGME